MKMRITMPELYREVGEGESPRPSIIAHRKMPWESNGVAIVSYEHQLYINLWLLEFDFAWIETTEEQP